MRLSRLGAVLDLNPGARSEIAGDRLAKDGAGEARRPLKSDNGYEQSLAGQLGEVGARMVALRPCRSPHLVVDLP